MIAFYHEFELLTVISGSNYPGSLCLRTSFCLYIPTSCFCSQEGILLKIQTSWNIYFFLEQKGIFLQQCWIDVVWSPVSKAAPVLAEWIYLAVLQTQDLTCHKHYIPMTRHGTRNSRANCSVLFLPQAALQRGHLIVIPDISLVLHH